MYIFRTIAKKLLAEVLIVRINPSKVTTYCEAPFYDTRQRLKQRFGKKAGTFLSDLMFWRSFFNPSGEWDIKTTDISKLPKYQNIKDLWQNKQEYTNTKMYTQMLKQLQSRGYTKYKNKTFKDKKSLDEFFQNYMLQLLFSMYSQGYDEKLDSEIPRAAIDREGRLVKSRRGRHRFSAAKVVVVKNMHLEIDSLHPLFLEKIDGGFSGKKLINLKKAIKAIEREYS